MTFFEIISISALLISVASLAVSTYSSLRDRARLRIKTKYYSASEYGPDRIVVSMVNIGRRPIILRVIGGSDSFGKWGGDYLCLEKGGIRLAEHEHYEYTYTKDDTVLFNPDGNNLFYESLWVEDSLGVRHLVPNSKAYVKRLWNAQGNTACPS